MPFADDDNLEDLTLVATNWKAKAAVQIAGSISLNWRTPVQRKPTITKGGFLEVQFDDDTTMGTMREYALFPRFF